MAARRPSDNESIDALIVAAKQLTQQLEEVKPPEAHDERDDSRPRPGSAFSKRSIPKPNLAANFKAIVKEAQLAKLGELETHEPERYKLVEREPDTQEWETLEQEASVLSDKSMSLKRFRQRGGCQSCGCQSVEQGVRICFSMRAFTA
jgi:hypothetical protein